MDHPLLRLRSVIHRHQPRPRTSQRIQQFRRPDPLLRPVRVLLLVRLLDRPHRSRGDQSQSELGRRDIDTGISMCGDLYSIHLVDSSQSSEMNILFLFSLYL